MTKIRKFTSTRLTDMQAALKAAEKKMPIVSLNGFWRVITSHLSDIVAAWLKGRT